MADDFAPAPKSTAMIRAGGGVQAIVPQTFDEAWRVAQALSRSGMLPKDFEAPEAALAVIMAGAEIGMAPFQSLQSFAFINKRPTLWGDGMLGVVRKFGVKVEERLDGEGDALTAWCKVTRPDTGEVVERSFAVADAKKAGLWSKQGPWTQYPRRMLQMRARGFALRDGCADMLRGLKMAEEVQDYEVTENAALPSGAPAIEGTVEEAGGAFIMGEAAELVQNLYASNFAAATSAEDVERHWASFKRKYWTGKRKCVSANFFDGLEELKAQALFRLESADATFSAVIAGIDGAADLHTLEAWRADDTTEVRFSKLTDEQRAQAEAHYEAKQEALADEIHAKLAAERGAK